MSTPGRAQTPGGGRYAFSDTTLMRDTLGLDFQRLFPLSDSLQVLPDTLRALSIRYLWSLERVVHVADSLRVPVDSIDAVMLRERFNPLASTPARKNLLTYNSGYSVGQTQSAWTNAADYRFRRGPVFVRNATNIEMDRYRVGGGTGLRQTRSSATEMGWIFSPDFSVGGRVSLDRLNTSDPVSNFRSSEFTDQYNLSVRSRQRPIRGMASEVNLFTGLLSVENATLLKHGVSGRVDGHVRYDPVGWLDHDLNASIDGNVARTRAPEAPVSHNTHDGSQNLRGTLSAFASAPISLRGNYSYRHVQVVTPVDTGEGIRRVLTDNAGADGTLRLRYDSDRYLDLTLRTGTTKQATVVGSSSRTSRRDDGVDVAARYLIWNCAIDAHFQNAFANSGFPNRAANGGYAEFAHTRALDGTLNRSLGRHLTARITANIGLTSYRYSIIGSYATPPVSHDDWHQSWSVQSDYTPGGRFSTGIVLQVGKSKLINIPGASVGSNSSSRSYSSEWHWTCRLLEGLTATQRNTLSADYLEYPYFPDNNRLSLDYSTATTLDAVLSPRLSVNLTYNRRRSPGGNFTLYPDGLSYFARSDENLNTSLFSRVAYAPTRAIGLTINPQYFSADRSAATNGVSALQRSSRSFNVTGGADINWTIFKKGTLRGNISRSYRADRTITYSSGEPSVTPRSQFDYWNGILQLSWHI